MSRASLKTTTSLMPQAFVSSLMTSVVPSVLAMSLAAVCANAAETVKQVHTTSPASAKEQADVAANGPGSIADSAVPAGLLQLPIASQYYSPYAFVVDKKARVLSVWHQTGNGLQEVAHFPADLGKNSGDKRGQGDAKTPEGIYFLTDRLEAGAGLDFKTYGKRAFPTDYPNFFDKQEGKTGNGIWLHAVPDQVPLTRGSKGCVVVRNDAILELTQYITLKKTPILIQDKTERMPVAELNKMTTDLNQWLESWRTAWQKKDLNTYMTYYSPEFKSMHMNREQWRRYKQNLNDMYQEIAVKISRPSIMADRNRAIVRFLQEYISDKKSDFGEKVLYLKREGNQFRIVGEQWAEETSKVARDEIEATTRSQAASPAPASTTADASTLKN